MKYLKYIVVLFSMLVLLGCNTLKKLDKSKDYQQASYSKPLMLPKDLQGSSSFENYYPIPKVANRQGPLNISLLPPGSKIKKK